MPDMPLDESPSVTSNGRLGCSIIYSLRKMACCSIVAEMGADAIALFRMISGQSKVALEFEFTLLTFWRIASGEDFRNLLAFERLHETLGLAIVVGIAAPAHRAPAQERRR